VCSLLMNSGGTGKIRALQEWTPPRSKMRPRRDPYGQLTQPGKTEMSRKVRHLKWSHAEKQIARKAFELALDREFRSVIRRAKDMAGKIEQPTDLWDLEHNLTESRKRIDRTYDRRYSVLIDVCGRLVREGRLIIVRTNFKVLGKTSCSLSAPTPGFWPSSTKWLETRRS
jgi:hypothetical protein